MSITDELRVFAKRWPCTDYIHKDMLAIADRIDAEHQKAIRELNNLADASVLLPRDADGVLIRVGDVLTDGEYMFVVDQLAVFGDGSWSIRNEDENAWKACDLHHHHAPTVEDVLREFAEKITDSQIPGVHPTYEEAIAEYAAKLQLREVDE